MAGDLVLRQDLEPDKTATASVVSKEIGGRIGDASVRQTPVLLDPDCCLSSSYPRAVKPDVGVIPPQRVLYPSQVGEDFRQGWEGDSRGHSFTKASQTLFCARFRGQGRSHNSPFLKDSPVLSRESVNYGTDNDPKRDFRRGP